MSKITASTSPATSLQLHLPFPLLSPLGPAARVSMNPT